MRPIGSPDVLQGRRLRAIDLLDQEHSLNEVARWVGCSPSSVVRWRDAFVGGGIQALNPKPTPGRPPKLTRKQKRRLVRLLLKGATAHGYATDLWTTQRIANLVENHFGVQYHRDHIGRLMHDLNWTHQKPERRALERDDAAIHDWKRTQWPRIKKTPRGWVPISSLSTNPDSS
ncbi:MAG TPA: IS630 family transposase [Candidatus Bathyarchaeia archaeon]|nr:IS630 family transposase [Candidatus Bathyarchaeia archaeon]